MADVQHLESEFSTMLDFLLELDGQLITIMQRTIQLQLQTQNFHAFEEGHQLIHSIQTTVHHLCTRLNTLTDRWRHTRESLGVAD